MPGTVAKENNFSAGLRCEKILKWRRASRPRFWGRMKQRPFRLYRRNLPHLRMEGATYFVTWRLRREQPELAPAERSAIAAALRHYDGDRYRLATW